MRRKRVCLLPETLEDGVIGGVGRAIASLQKYLPQYGWEIHPVTLVVEHEEFGKIGMKTEVHSENEPSKPIIFSSL